MRDTFLGLNQKRVLELKQRYLDGKGESFIKTEDLILIRRIQDFMNSSKTIQVVIDNEVYSWVHYETVKEDLPMIFPSVVSLKKRVEKLKKLKLIINKDYPVTKKMSEEKEGFETPGKYSVIRFSKECRTLFDFTGLEDSNYHEGVKGQHHEGVKGQHHEGVIKEYHDLNTVKGTPIRQSILELKKLIEEQFKKPIYPNDIDKIIILSNQYKVNPLEIYKNSDYLRGLTGLKPTLNMWFKEETYKKMSQGGYVNNKPVEKEKEVKVLSDTTFNRLYSAYRDYGFINFGSEAQKKQFIKTCEVKGIEFSE